MSRAEFKNREYSIISIYYDMFNTPINIDIKKIIEDNIISNIHNKPLFLIRILKQKGTFYKFYNNIVNEKGINYRRLSFGCPSVIWNYRKIGFLNFRRLYFDHTAKISDNWCKIVDNNKITIDNIIIVTPDYINIIDEIKHAKKVSLITNSEMVNKYNSKKVRIINYDKYIKNDIEGEIKEYEIYSLETDYRTRFMSKNELYILNLLAEAFNDKDLNYTCLVYQYDIMKNIEYEERIENVNQYILSFDYMKSLE
jgi:hypothetical protein